MLHFSMHRKELANFHIDKPIQSLLPICVFENDSFESVGSIVEQAPDPHKPRFFQAYSNFQKLSFKSKHISNILEQKKSTEKRAPHQKKIKRIRKNLWLVSLWSSEKCFRWFRGLNEPATDNCISIVALSSCSVHTSVSITHHFGSSLYYRWEANIKHEFLTTLTDSENVQNLDKKGK